MPLDDNVSTGSAADRAVVSTPRVLGIDPGLNVTGYAVIECAGATMDGITLVEAGVIRGRGRQLGPRLVELYRGITEVIQSLSPGVLAIEELYTHYERPRTAVLMGHARGVLCLAASEAGLPLTSYAATRVKRVLTGNGRAPKSQVQMAVTRHLHLREIPKPHDVADALAIALCHAFISDLSRRLKS